MLVVPSTCFVSSDDSLVRFAMWVRFVGSSWSESRSDYCEWVSLSVKVTGLKMFSFLGKAVKADWVDNLVLLKSSLLSFRFIPFIDLLISSMSLK